MTADTLWRGAELEGERAAAVVTADRIPSTLPTTTSPSTVVEYGLGYDKLG